MASSYSPNWALIIVFRLKPDRRLITDSATTTAPGLALQADAPLDPPTTKTTLLHQMRPWPPAWRRPREDRPPYAVWVIASLAVWAFILAGFKAWDLHSTSRTVIWAIFRGWCIGVLGASIARKIYR